MNPPTCVGIGASRRSSAATMPTVRVVRERFCSSAVASFTPINCCRAGGRETFAYPLTDEVIDAPLGTSSAYCGTYFMPQSGARPGLADLFTCGGPRRDIRLSQAITRRPLV